ncbi:hypothetical protein [Sphingopyxis sp. 113P3]|uniref:hypothetical protein n=1 Tax=Sphingopyxis sp. (strain 113P3) TaxID=292913 RepID=UPI0006AD0FC6|nr:hypothetical protein [Sphingopyxis sp. 113P3]ALC13827.1 hypothetical protein LH20_17865 [Sphingopyxis sp. 113P3]
MEEKDLAALFANPLFRDFLFVAIQRAGILQPANGHDLRDLAFAEGRRSLGLELLQLVDAGQPKALRSPDALATLHAVILTALNPPSKPEEKKRADRYDDIPD